MKRTTAILSLLLFMLMNSIALAEGTGIYMAPKFLMSIQDTGPFSRSASFGGSGVDDYSQFTLGGALALGYDLWPQQMLPLRLEVEFALRGNSEKKWDDKGARLNSVKGVWNNSTLFANAFWDFHNDSPFTPYLGAGIGMAFNYTGYEVTLKNGETYSADDRFTNLAWNVGAGFSYDLNDFIALDASYRFVGLGYNEVSKTVDGITAKIENEPYNNEFMVGVRLSF